jgi:hypothetical protein
MSELLVVLLMLFAPASPEVLTSRLAGDLRAGMELVYTSNGAAQPPWTVQVVEPGAALKGNADCARVRIRRQPDRVEAPEERLCIERGMLHAWDANRAAWQPQRPVGARMELKLPRPNGDTLHYTTSSIGEEVVSGLRVPVVNTTMTTIDPAGQPKRRLVERYCVTLTTATGGRFEAPDANAPGGWRTEQQFELREIRVP